MIGDPLKSHIRDWQEMAAVDPFRAVLVQKQGWHVPDFFATAQPLVDQLLSICSSTGLPIGFERVLEFGCGVGRFLPHFQKRFGEVWGVDISQEMIDVAQQYNPRCRFHLNTTTDLSFFPRDRFDLVYSFLVLQHLPDRSMIAKYIKEFIRILKPGGLAVFQIPNRLSLRWKIQPRRRIYHLLRVLGLEPEWLQSWNLLPMRLTALPESAVVESVLAAGGRVCLEEPLEGTEGIFYYCTK